MLAPGTYRDYEQGRSDPVRIVAYALRNRIHDYDVAYAKYLQDKKYAQKPGAEAAAAEPALAGA